jgi:hypothetical protein
MSDPSAANGASGDKTPPNPPPGMKTRPDARAAALDDAKLLLHYAIKQGVELEDETTKTLIEIMSDIETKGWNPVSELTFWAAYAQLAKAARPVTAESLRSIDHGSARPPRAITEVVLTSVVTGVALALLLTLQIYWVIGSNIVTTIDRLISDVDRFQTQMQAADYQLFSITAISEAAQPAVVTDPSQPDQPRPSTNSAPAADLQREFVRLKLEYESNSRSFDQGRRILEANYALLNDWRNNSLNFFGSNVDAQYAKPPEPIEGEESYELKDRAERLKELSSTIALSDAKSTLQSMASYMLPLLYGLVGACAYVLRAVSRDMRDVVFYPGSPVHYRLRLLLGALSGIAIGWFFTPEQLPSGLKGIQPLALAFLAGYSVELLFAAMDRFISAFSGESRAPGQAK